MNWNVWIPSLNPRACRVSSSSFPDLVPAVNSPSGVIVPAAGSLMFHSTLSSVRSFPNRSNALTDSCTWSSGSRLSSDSGISIRSSIPGFTFPFMICSISWSL